MSYILDALRRADAERERERGGVPGLHSMQVGSAVPAAPAGTPWAVGALALAVLSALLLLGWWFWPAAPMPEPALATASSAAPPAALSSAPAVAGASSATPTAPPVSARGGPAPAPGAAPPPAKSGAVPPPARRVVRESATPPPVPAAVTAARRSADSAGPPATSSDPPDSGRSAAVEPRPLRPEEKVVAFEQLPDDVKRALPPLAVGGAIYSDNPGSRLLMIGGQLLKEGDAAGPGVTLEQIRQRSAVLRWKDVRYEVSF